VNPTGGSIPGGATLRVSLCAVDANGLPSPPAVIAIVQTPPGTNTNRIVLSGIVWPAVTNLASYAVFVSDRDDLICKQQTGALTAGANSTYTPGSITINGPFTRSTWALPSPYVSKVRIKAKRLVHSGVIGAPATSVTAPNQIMSTWLIDNLHLTSFNPVGRILSVIGRAESSTPFLSALITAYDGATGTVTLSPNIVVAGHPELSIQPEDVFVIRYRADAPNSGNPTQITDSGCHNMEYPAGMTPGAEVGNVLRVIQGTGRGQLRKITGNTATQLSWDLPLVLDETSVWIVEAPAWDYSGDSTAISNADSLRAVTLNVPTDNFIDQALLIAGFTVDVNGIESPDGDALIREDWVFGAEGQSKAAGFSLAAPGVLSIQADAAPALYLNQDFTAGAVKAYIKAAPVGADLTFTLYAGAAPWMTLTIPDGGTSVVATDAQIAAASPIPANANIRLALAAVGTAFPGSDLSVFIYA
jgi:hypothetical protein